MAKKGNKVLYANWVSKSVEGVHQNGCLNSVTAVCSQFGLIIRHLRYLCDTLGDRGCRKIVFVPMLIGQFAICDTFSLFLFLAQQKICLDPLSVKDVEEVMPRKRRKRIAN